MAAVTAKIESSLSKHGEVEDLNQILKEKRAGMSYLFRLCLRLMDV